MIKSFVEVCEKQRVLDGEVGKVRGNGFKPKERTEEKIMLSIIAETIEFNEELEETHKTWKQKEIKRESQLEELTDILFFIAQWVNFIEDRDNFVEDYVELYDTKGNSIEDKNFWLLDFIDCVNSRDLDQVLESYCGLVGMNNFEISEIYAEYERKWEINMQRINKDWTLESGK